MAAPSPRVLLTGASGFVGRHLAKALAARFGPAASIIPTARVAEDGFAALDICDAEGAAGMLAAVRPTHVVNLAAIAAPVDAQRSPAAAWRLHAEAPMALGRAILAIVPDCWLLHVSSGMVYGRSGLCGEPLAETAALAPLDDYGVTKAAGDLAVGMLAHRGLRCVVLRPFNHTGPGQSDSFAIPAFAAQIARIEAGLADPVLRVGNLESVRDFLDVRDVVDAYARVIERTGSLQPGTVFNVASGRSTEMAAALAVLLGLGRRAITVESDPARMRPSDLPCLLGDAARLRDAVGWQPAIPLEQTLRDVLDGFRHSHGLPPG